MANYESRWLMLWTYMRSVPLTSQKSCRRCNLSMKTLI